MLTFFTGLGRYIIPCVELRKIVNLMHCVCSCSVMLCQVGLLELSTLSSACVRSPCRVVAYVYFCWAKQRARIALMGEGFFFFFVFQRLLRNKIASSAQTIGADLRSQSMASPPNSREAVDILQHVVVVLKELPWPLYPYAMPCILRRQ